MPAFFFFFLSGREAQRRGDPCLRGGGTGAGPRPGEGATLFFFGVGRDPQTRFAGGPDEGDHLAGAFPFLLFPPFWGGFPWSGHTRGGLGGGLAERESLEAGVPGPLPGVFFVSPPCPPVAPQAEAIALRREVERLQAHPSAVEIDRLRFRARPRRRLRSVAVAEDPLAVVFPLFFFPIDPSQEREPARPSSASTWKKRSGPRPFFFFGFFFSSAERALRSAERALRSAERAL